MTRQSIVKWMVAIATVMVLYPPHEFGQYHKGVWYPDKFGIAYGPIWAPPTKILLPTESSRSRTVLSQLDLTRLFLQLGLVLVGGGLLAVFGVSEHVDSPSAREPE